MLESTKEPNGVLDHLLADNISIIVLILDFFICTKTSMYNVQGYISMRCCWSILIAVGGGAAIVGDCVLSSAVL